MSILVLPILVPLLAGAILLAVRNSTARVVIGVISGLIMVGVTGVVALRTLAGEIVVNQMAGWKAPFGIALVADSLSGPLVFVVSIFALLTVIFVATTLRVKPMNETKQSKALVILNKAREVLGTQALLQFLFAGVNMSLLTGDLFNLFVAFEVMLLASYGLLLLGGELPQLREGFKYVIVNLVASSLFVAAAGLSYGLFGTLNLADISARVAEHGPDIRVTLVAALLALVFATKAAVFPLGFWLPDSYPAPPVAIGAFFAAVLTKVGVYALIRLFSLLFPEEAFIQTVLLALGGITILVGALGMLSRRRWRHTMAFANIASIGYLMAALFSGGEQGLTVGLYYLLTSITVMYVLFAVAGIAERVSAIRFQISGHMHLYPWLAAAYFIAALTMIGMPPTSGFLAKLGLLQGLFARGGVIAVFVAVLALVGSLIILYTLMRIWESFFWGETDQTERVTVPRQITAVTGVATTILVALAVFAGPLFDGAAAVTSQLTDRDTYIGAVLLENVPPRMGGQE